MKTLKTLIKLSKNNLDQTLAELNNLEKEKTRLMNKKHKFEAEMAEESKKYSTSEYAYMLDKYLDSSHKTLLRIDVQIRRSISSIEKVQATLREQYSELKKFEIALENRIKLEAEKQKKLEDKALDEFNINKFAINQGQK